jgi:hypothetical protein
MINKCASTACIIPQQKLIIGSADLEQRWDLAYED